MFPLVLLDMIVFTHVVCRSEYKSSVVFEALKPTTWFTRSNSVCPTAPRLQHYSHVLRGPGGSCACYRDVIKAGCCVNDTDTDTFSLCLHHHLEYL